ncbi:tyrosine-type recombinase/integrase [Deinococcus peraridilitoris]|uniref:Site-specific recombinase XerD n=1 Tax=Deinococcus peraridilitoris (strain DSM 19664 / LMG 22246 / CIP 109416 / KR-200) TaxID=937777 RepID=L0A7S0_DEIPD|nr:site-specific integrase [Deinococcus peraridilitoris]AFZ69489.1 site-specific recombinase XerD [Deinococcus peraridilitoris DSM 19664]
MPEPFHTALQEAQSFLPERVELIRRHLSQEHGLNAVLDLLEPHLPQARGTRINTRSGIRIYLQWARDQGRSVLHPDPKTGEDYLQYLKSRYDTQANTLNNRLSQARSFYNVLHGLGHSVPDPFDRLDNPRYDPAAHRDTYTPEELIRLLAHADTEGKVMVLLGAHAGLTGPEVVSLRWSDIRMHGEILSIKKRLVEEPQELLGALRTLAQSRGVLHDVRAPTLFQSDGNARLFSFENDNELRHALYSLCGHANVNSRSPRSTIARGWRALRNNAGLRILELTGDPEVVQERLGLGTLKAVQPLIEKHKRQQSR